MCGIAGQFAYHYAALPVDRDEIRSIRDRMASRGPDGAGEWYSEDERVGFAHRRLSIIDLSDRAAQPMISADGSLVITFNGEIYNYRELREELAAKGRVFRTTSDTEVLLQLYAEKGADMLQVLRGMFAFAIWDQRRAALFLARDPYGIKPLYYADDGWTLRFASQVKALLTSPRVGRAPDPAGVAGFYLFGSVPEPYTLYREIRSVPAGSYQWVDATGPTPPVAYMSVATVWQGGNGKASLPPAALREAVREVVLDSVRHHLVSDVPVGAFLSAGIDSGTLVGLMKDAGQQEVHGVTLAFSEFLGRAEDESVLAAEVAALYGVRHSIRQVDEREFLDDWPRILDAMDQPSIDGVNSWFVSKVAHEAGLKVAVSGVGGDELFGGYGLFREIPQWVRWLWLPSRVPGLGRLMEQAQAIFAPLFPRVHPKARGLFRYGGSYEGTWFLRRGLFLPSELPRVLGHDMAHEGLHRLRLIPHIRAGLSTASGPASRRPIGRYSPFGRVAALDSTFYLRNVLLRDTDWASMAHSLEVRTPLVDRVVLEKLAPILRDAGAIDRKAILASSPSRPLPAATLSRAKTGFATPLAGWQKDLPQVRMLLETRLLHRDAELWSRQWGRFVAASMVSQGTWPRS